MKSLSAAYQQSEYATGTRARISQILSEVVSLQTPTFSLHYKFELMWTLKTYAEFIMIYLLVQSGRGGIQEFNKGSASWIRQCWTLTQRSFVNMMRDPGYYWLRVAMYVMVGICLGTIFWRVGFKYSSILVSYSLCLVNPALQLTTFIQYICDYTFIYFNAYSDIYCCRDEQV